MRLVLALSLVVSFAASAQNSALHLLDSGKATNVESVRGGTAPPTGPTTIFYPPASTMAAPVPPGFGFPGAVFGTGMGAYAGNLFLPTVPGYPPTFLTAGGVSGFDVTGAFAWHLAPTTMAAIARVFGVGAAVPTTVTPGAAASVASGFMAVFASTGLPAPSGLISGPGAVAPPVRITSPAIGVFCGLVVGGPGFATIGAGPAGNGLGGISGVALPPLRTVMLGPVTGSPIMPVPAAPAAYIAGCFADSATTPVELQAFDID